MRQSRPHGLWQFFLWTDTQKSTTSFPPYKDKYDTKECLRRQASTAIAYNLNAHLLTFCPSFNLFVCDLPTERLLVAPQSCVLFARRSLPFYWHFSNFSPYRAHPHLWGDTHRQRFADHYLIIGIEKARPKPLFSKYFHCATMMASVQRRVNSDKAIDRIGNAASGQKRNKPLLFKDLTSYPNRRSSIFFLATNS